jgi:DNA-binding NtrC family response regulator
MERAFILGDPMLELKPLVQNGVARSHPAAHANHAAHGPQGGDAERLEIRVGSRIYDMERSLIEATLDYFKGNKRRAANALGCSLKTLYNKLNGYSQSQECANS